MRGLLVPVVLLLITAPVATRASQSQAEAEPSVEAAEPSDVAEPAPPLETARFELQHLDTDAAATLLRTILQIRQVVQLTETRTVVIRDDPQTVQQALQLLSELDVASPQWRIDLCAETAAGERVLREMPIEDEMLDLEFGTADDGRVVVKLRPQAPGGAELSVIYEFYSRIRYDPSVPAFGFAESGKATLGDMEELELLRATQPGVDRVLATVLGQPQPISRLYLRLKRIE